MSGVADRLFARPQTRPEGYAFCAEDRFWFRPAYTEGKCPLCGSVALEGAPRPSRWRGVDRSWLGMAGLAFESLAMLSLVTFMYFRR